MDVAETFATPYVRICFQPRATIRAIVDRNPRHMVIVLAVVSAVVGASLNLTVGSDPTAFTIAGKPIPIFDPHKWRIFNLVGLAAAPVLAVALLYVNGALFRWSGSLLGGTARTVEVRAALAWAAIPWVLSSLLAGLAGSVLSRIKGPEAYDLAAIAAHLTQMLPYLVVRLFLFGWALVVMMKCLAEVHRFSAWRALGSWTIGLFAAIGGLFVTVVISFLATVPFLH